MTLNPPVVRASFSVPNVTWTRLPDDGFEIHHSGAGVQTIGAQPMTVQIRRLGPAVTDPVARPTVAAVWRPEESADRPCSYCEATDRVLKMARLFEDADESTAELFDALVRVAEHVSRRSPSGRRLARTVLGITEED